VKREEILIERRALVTIIYVWSFMLGYQGFSLSLWVTVDYFLISF
jgi:hypothetical protein